MARSMGTPSKRQKRTTGAANPYALALKDGRYRQRMVQSKVKYNRAKHKRSNKQYTYLID